MKRLASLAIGACAAIVVGCTSSSSTSCSFDDPAVVPTPMNGNPAWPKFHHDRQNTGVTSAAIPLPVANPIMGPIMGPTPAPFVGTPGPFVASPVLDDSGSVLYIGSTDGRMYALNAADLSSTSFDLNTPLPITTAALVATRDAHTAIFFGGGDERVYGVGDTAAAQSSVWPATVTGFITTAPAISPADGSIYVGTENGLFAAVCPNGAARFALSQLDPIRTAPAFSIDGTVYFAAGRQFSSVRADGLLKWTFAASAPIIASPVLEETTTTTVAIYVADSDGKLFKLDPLGRIFTGALPLPGQPLPTQSPQETFSFPGIAAAIRSTPALCADAPCPSKRLYFGADDGVLYAVEADTGAIDWQFPTGGAIVSSPAVALGGSAPVIVFGSNDGSVYFVEDGGAAPTQSAAFAIAPACGNSGDANTCGVVSSPAIGADGSVYVGSTDGHVYAFRAAG